MSSSLSQLVWGHGRVRQSKPREESDEVEPERMDTVKKERELETAGFAGLRERVSDHLFEEFGSRFGDCLELKDGSALPCASLSSCSDADFPILLALS